MHAHRRSNDARQDRLGEAAFGGWSSSARERVRPPILIDSTEVPNVLVVEDEMVLRMRAVDIVEDAGFHPVEAVTASDAISILVSCSDLSLVLTHIKMPCKLEFLNLAQAVNHREPAIHRHRRLQRRNQRGLEQRHHLDLFRAGYRDRRQQRRGHHRGSRRRHHFRHLRRVLGLFHADGCSRAPAIHHGNARNSEARGKHPIAIYRHRKL